MRQAYLENICFVLALARSLGVHRPADREDLAQETFALACQHVERYDPARGSMRAWLASIAVHRAKSWRKLARNRLDHGAEPDEQQDPGHSQEHRTATEQVRELARRLLDQLPDDLRLPLELVDFHEFTMTEAATALELPFSTFSTRYYKARGELQRKIDKLLKQKAYTADDFRTGAFPIPADVAGILDALRSPDLAVDGRSAERIWSRVLAGPPPEDLPSAGQSGTPGAGTRAPAEAVPAKPTAPSPGGGTSGAGSAADRILTSVGALSGGGKLTGVLSLLAAAGVGAALHAALAPHAPPAPAAMASEVIPAGPAIPAALASTPVQAGSAGATVTSTPAPTATAAPNESEANLMDRMRAAVASRPAEVLSLAQKHARAYPGKNAQEREALVILALSRTGRRGEAQGRAQSFRAAYPQSAYVPIIDAELGDGGP